MRHEIALALIIMLGAGTGAASAQEQPPGWNDGAQDRKVEVGVVRLTPEAVQRIKDALIQRGYTFRDSSGTTGTGQSPIAPGDDTRTIPSVPGVTTDTPVQLYDPELQANLARFQKDLALPSSGDVDLNTLDALGLEVGVFLGRDVKGAELAHVNGFDATTRPAGMPKVAPMVGGGHELIGFVILDAGRVKTIQDRLKTLGYYNGEVDGTYSQAFADAIRHFQDADGIRNVNGIIDMRTLSHFPQVSIIVKSAVRIPSGDQNPQNPQNPAPVPDRPQPQPDGEQPRPALPPSVPGVNPLNPGDPHNPINPANPVNPPG